MRQVKFACPAFPMSIIPFNGTLNDNGTGSLVLDFKVDPDVVKMHFPDKDNPEMFASLSFSNIPGSPLIDYSPRIEDYLSFNRKIFKSINDYGEFTSCGRLVCSEDAKDIEGFFNELSKGDSGPVVEKLNIWLTGFGGGVPSDTFDDVLEKKVKTFQKDYMGIKNPSGIFDQDTYGKIKEFAKKYKVSFEKETIGGQTYDTKCPCGECDGFGNKSNNGNYKISYNKATNTFKISTTGDEINHLYEYPGIHKSLIWLLMGSNYYYGKKSKALRVKSGYRCNERQKQKDRPTCGHLGKALDIHIFDLKDNKLIRDANNKGKYSDELRTYFINNCNASLKRTDDKFWMEPKRFSSGAAGATTWVHIDVTEFQEKYLEDRFFYNELNFDSELNIS